MKNDEIENMLNRMETPEPEKIMQQPALKIPLLSYRRSSRAGLWLLLIPLTFVFTVVLKMIPGINTAYLDIVRKFFSAVDDHTVLTYLIPVIFIGLPLAAMIINFLAICHFHQDKKLKELIVTIKYRPVNIALCLLSFALLIYFLLPDKLAF